MSFDSVWAPVDGQCVAFGQSIECFKSCGTTIMNASYFDLYCFDPTAEGFCVDFRYSVFLIWFPFLLVVLTAHVLSRLLCSSFRPSPLTFFMNYVGTGLFSCLVTGFYCISHIQDFGFVGVIMIIMMPAVYQIMLACLSQCPLSRTAGAGRADPRFVRIAMHSPLLSGDDRAMAVAAVRRNPPLLELGVPGAVIAWPLPYVSWEERCDEVVLPRDAFLVVDFDVRVETTQTLMEFIEQHRESQVRALAARWGPVSLVLRPRVNGDTAAYAGCVAGQPSLARKFVHSKCGKFVWGLLMMMGLNSVMEAMYCIGVSRFTVKSVKWVSEQDIFHCPAGFMDLHAPTVSDPQCD
jgi:hypothetical protein